LGFETRNPLRPEAFPLSAYFPPAAAGSFNPHALFNRLPTEPHNDSLKWAIGNALSVLDGNRCSDALMSIALEKRHGFTRQMIVTALGRIKHPQATLALIELLDCKVALKRDPVFSSNRDPSGAVVSSRGAA
jgi:HEAT repeat protein